MKYTIYIKKKQEKEKRKEEKWNILRPYIVIFPSFNPFESFA